MVGLSLSLSEKAAQRQNPHRTVADRQVFSGLSDQPGLFPFLPSMRNDLSGLTEWPDQYDI
jgi:hypothetical protein